MRSPLLLIGALACSVACGPGSVTSPAIIDMSSYAPGSGDNDSASPPSKTATTPTIAGLPGPSDLVLAINIGGSATGSNEGPFVGELDSHAIISGGTHYVLDPAPTPALPDDPGLAAVAADGVWSYTSNMTVDVPIDAGSYNVVLYVAEDKTSESFQLYFEDNAVDSEQSTGAPGTWHAIGPYAVTVTDGLLSLRATGGFRLAGLEIHRAGGVPTGFSPCPVDGSSCRIMPLGDSITAGVGSSTGGGYRVQLFQDALDHQQSIIFVGSQTSGPATVDSTSFSKENEGHSGYTIDDTDARTGIATLTPTMITTYNPNVVLLMIGTNDIDTQYQLSGAPDRLAALVDSILATSDDLLLVIATLTPTKDDSENTRDVAYNGTIANMVQARASSGKHIVMVDMYAAFTAHAAYKTDYMSDTLHPNDAGHAVMGNTWYAAISKYLN